MFSKVGLMFLHAVSSVHAGSGSELGLVDLPIQREKHTGYPKIESSSLKGAIRAAVQEQLEGQKLEKYINIVFGREGEQSQNNAQAGALAWSDARILLFPVKSLRGVFAWVSCQQVLKRFNDELALYRPDIGLLPVPPVNSVSGQRLIISPEPSDKQVVLEEYTYHVTEDAECKQLATRLAEDIFPLINNDFTERLLILPDNDFVDFVSLSTEVNARIRIDTDTGTAQGGALWYEENVPPETVFYSFVFAGKSRQAGQEMEAGSVLGFVADENNFPAVFQLGGNSTLGRGILRRIWI